MIFTPIEVATLERLYPDRQAYLELLYLLSDRVQDDAGEAVADGIRFVCAIRHLPYGNRDVEGLDGPDFWWCRSTKPMFSDEYDNYLPNDVWNKGMINVFSWTNGVEEFAVCWAMTPSDVRNRLWSEWTQEVPV